MASIDPTANGKAPTRMKLKTNFWEALNKALEPYDMEAKESDVDFYLRNKFTVEDAVKDMIAMYL